MLLHRQGKLGEAEPFYAEVLQHHPTHFYALHFLGLIALQTGRTQYGVDLITKAIGLNSTVGAAYNHLGAGLMDLKRPEEALARFDKAIALEPDFVEGILQSRDCTS